MPDFPTKTILLALDREDDANRKKLWPNAKTGKTKSGGLSWLSIIEVMGITPGLHGKHWRRYHHGHQFTDSNAIGHLSRSLSLSNVGLWNGNKDFSFSDPNNYLELRHNAPPAVVLSTDQDSEYPREAIQAKSGTAFDHVDLHSFQRTIYENADGAHWRINHGPGGLPDFDWIEEQNNFELETDSQTGKQMAASTLVRTSFPRLFLQSHPLTEYHQSSSSTDLTTRHTYSN